MSTTAENLIPFDLATALKHPERVRHRDGSKAKWLTACDAAGPANRILIVWDSNSAIFGYTENGFYTLSNCEPSIFLTAPEPVYVPWTSLAEVPLDHWFRYKGSPIARRIIDVNLVHPGLQLSNDQRVSYLELFAEQEHSADPIKGPWLPCGKLATT